MKLNKKRIVIFSVIIVIFILLLPILYKDRTYNPLVGPSLSEIEYTEISFNNGNLKLAGMMILPEGEGPFPVAVMIHGSGTSYRDNKWYLSVVNHLQKNGIAVLLPDKRGSEKAGGKWIGASFEDLAGDTMAAIEYIKTQDYFDYSKIGIIGMSQGGWIAPIVATKTNLSFVVSISGPMVTQEEQLLHEEIHNIAPYTYTFIAKLIAPITTKNLMKKEHVKGFIGYDPIPYWEQINIPAFIVFGGNDKNVPIEKCVERLKKHNLDNNKIEVYSDGGHGIMDIKTNKIQNEFLNDLVNFIKEN